MPGNHQVFVGCDRPRGCSRARRADAWAARRVGDRVDVDAEPGRTAAHTFADRGGVFANAAGEDDGIESAEGGRERAELATDAIAVQIDREARPRIARGEQRPHVVGYATQT